jgi:hypothetical protein
MPNINTNIIVGQAGMVFTGFSNDSIGTQGCGPCVGLLVVYRNTMKICAHFECDQAPNSPAAIAYIENVTRAILLRQRTNINNITSIACCTGNPRDRSAAAIINAIDVYFFNDPVAIFTADGLYWNNNTNQIRPLAFNDVLVPGPAVLNGIASIPPMP